MKRNFVRKIFLEELPRKYGFGNNANKLTIDWEKCKGFRIKFIYDDIEGYIEIVDYKSKGQKAKIKYNQEEKYIQTSGIINCQLGGVLGKFTKEFKYKIGQRVVDGKRDITIIDRKIDQAKNGQWLKYYKYYCNKCTFNCCEHYSSKDKKYKNEFWTIEGSLESGAGCSCCCSASQIVVEGINDIATTNSWLIPIINNLEFCKTHTYCTEEKIYPTCPSCKTKSHKKIVPRNINEDYIISCKKCGDGIKYPNKFGFNLLEQLNVDFETEYSPEWIGLRRYDFYFKLNNKKYILEMDGGWHIRDNKMSGQTKEESKAIDDEKDRLAIEYGIEVIRIDCDYENNNRSEYIKQNILKDEKLNELFDLSKINWNRIEEFACSNLVKEVCDLWNSGINNTSEIINMTKLSPSAVRKYLHVGVNNSWCNYDSKEEMRKSANNNRPKSKQVEVFKDGVSLGIFESAYELARQSEKLFEIKLNPQGIGKVCLGKKPQYKGYTFKFI